MVGWGRQGGRQAPWWRGEGPGGPVNPQESPSASLPQPLRRLGLIIGDITLAGKLRRLSRRDGPSCTQKACWRRIDRAKRDIKWGRVPRWWFRGTRPPSVLAFGPRCPALHPAGRASCLDGIVWKSRAPRKWVGSRGFGKWNGPVMSESGAPGGTRTRDKRFRKPLLYPTELQGRPK